jgi:S-adenosylmethionine-diacylglycerol 3-amino-3-carboxypropyl transferase
MPVANAIQFAIVREDPAAELAVVDTLVRPDAQVLLVASGGCTALTLAALRPSLRLTLLDANPAQLALVERKFAALRDLPAGSLERRRAFGVDVDDASSFSGGGNFESLFRGLRAVLDDLVLPAADRRAILEGRATPETLTQARTWPVAFALFFSDLFLETMFGPDATQHAPRGSYPGYFQRVVERGLARGDVAQNPWLHHVLLGHWLEGALPAYLTTTFVAKTPPLVHATMQAAPDFSAFDLVQLSNLFDWMPADVVDGIIARLCRECRPGTVVLLRQLNNRRPVEQAFAAVFDLVEPLSTTLTTRDQSLFYERVLVFRRR